MKLFRFVFAFFILLSSSSYAYVRNVCVNGACHVVIDHGASVIVDGQMNTADSYGSGAVSDSRHNYQLIDRNYYYLDNEYHHRTDPGDGRLFDNGELYHPDVR